MFRSPNWGIIARMQHDFHPTLSLKIDWNLEEAEHLNFYPRNLGLKFLDPNSFKKVDCLCFEIFYDWKNLCFEGIRVSFIARTFYCRMITWNHGFFKYLIENKLIKISILIKSKTRSKWILQSSTDSWRVLKLSSMWQSDLWVVPLLG